MIKFFPWAIVTSALLVITPTHAEDQSQDPFAVDVSSNEGWLDSLASPVSPAEVIATFKEQQKTQEPPTPSVDLESFLDQATSTIENVDIYNVVEPEQPPQDLLDIEIPSLALTPEQIAEQQMRQAQEDAALLEQLQTAPALQPSQEGVRLAGIVTRINQNQGAQKVRSVASNYAFFHKHEADRLDQVAQFFNVPVEILAYVNGMNVKLDQNVEASLVIPGGVFANIYMPPGVSKDTSLGELAAISRIDPLALLAQPSLSESLVLEAETQLMYPAPKGKLPEQQQALRLIESKSLNQVASAYGIRGQDLVKHNNTYEIFVPARTLVSYQENQVKLGEELFEGEWLMDLAKRINQTPNDILGANPSLLELPIKQGSVLLIPPASAYEDALALNTFQVYQAVNFKNLMEVLKGDPALWIQYNPSLLDLAFTHDAQYVHEGRWYLDVSDNTLFAKPKASQAVSQLASLIGVAAADLRVQGDFIEADLALVFSNLQAKKAQASVYALVSGTLNKDVSLFQAQRLERDFGSLSPQSAWWLRQQSKELSRVEVGPFDDVDAAIDVCTGLHTADLFCAPIVEMDTHTYTPLDGIQKRVALIELTDKQGNINHYNLSGSEALEQYELQVESVSQDSASIIWRGDAQRLPVTGLPAGARSASPKVTGSLEDPIVDEIPVRRAAQVLLAQNQKLMSEVESITSTSKDNVPVPKESAPVAKALNKALLRNSQLLEPNNNPPNAQPDAQPQVPPPSVSLLDGWDDNDYVWQLMVARDVNSLKRLKVDLGEQMVQLEIEKAGKPLYMALMGAYKSKAEAKAAWAQVSASTKKLKPWLRPVGQLKQQIGRQ